MKLSAIASPLRWAARNRIDVSLAVALAVLSAGLSMRNARHVSPLVMGSDSDTWFDSDAGRVYDNMTDRKSNHYRVKVHPLYSLSTYPLVRALEKGAGLRPDAAVRWLIAAVAAAWAIALFSLLRMVGCRRFDGSLFTVLAILGAASVFWFAVPETYSFGSVSIVAALCVAAAAQSRRLSDWWFTLVSALSMSYTITNWMAGIFATRAHHPWRRTLQISVNAFAIVVVLWGVQKVGFDSAEFFLGDREETHFLRDPRALGALQVARSFFLHTMIMPALQVADNPTEPGVRIMMLVQESAPGSGGPWGRVAVALWVAALALGAWGFVRLRGHNALRFALAATLLGQLLLHTLYGLETFLYALHFLPLLVVLAALGTLTRARPVVLALTGVLVVCVSINNFGVLDRALATLRSRGNERHLVRAQMLLRSNDPWPRGTGHVVLATPGSVESRKSYLEPGGDFSPTVGSFGVSLWWIDPRDGSVAATAGDVPLDQTEQRFIAAPPASEGGAAARSPACPTGILTRTPQGDAEWTLEGAGRWRLRVRSGGRDGLRRAVVLRSVGPAGGPVTALDWDGSRLLVNDRWIVRAEPPPSRVHLGEEAAGDWTTRPADAASWRGDSGWGYARLVMADVGGFQVDIEDTEAAAIDPPPELKVESGPWLDLPDERFVSCLRAQVAHLLMGVVGDETRPGDPTNYPLAWLRDGAYIVVALTRAGQLEIAGTLSRKMAEEDFYGGFGAEADAPGLAIWALEEVARHLDRPGYDRWIWPHVRRKAELIEEMIATDRQVFKPFTGPVVPYLAGNGDLTRVAEPPLGGLILGKMDHHRPLLFVNAVSFRGLVDAARLAERLNHAEDARRWRRTADNLQRAWIAALRPPESLNVRTAISGLWPSGVTAPAADAFRALLEQRWARIRDQTGTFRAPPNWTYFDVAEAHQWLLLGEPDRVWDTLDWYFANQVAPGLYSWWEGQGEENSFRLWRDVRGWVDPPYVTPHYWTAAEMLLLQLDMLAHLDESGAEPTVVVGAGIPGSWLGAPFGVRDMPLPGGRLDFDWDGTRMRVHLHGSKRPVRLGGAFGDRTPLRIEHSVD